MTKIEQYEMRVLSKQGVLFLVGKPGTAKSAIGQEIAKRNNLQLIDLRAALKDSAEINGYPIVEEVMTKDGPVKSMSYAIPKWAILSNEKPSLVFFDEIDRATKDTQNALFQILYDHKIGEDFKFNDNVYFMCAGNGEYCDLDELDYALYNRLIFTKHNMEVDHWIADFAIPNNINKEIVNFLKNRPTLLWKKDKDDDKNYATPRSWTFFSNFLDYAKAQTAEEVLGYIEFAEGYIGAGTANTFRTYLVDKLKISIDDVMNKFNEIKEDLLTECKRDKVSELLHELKGKDLNEMTRDQIKNISGFLQIIDMDERITYLSDLLLEDKYIWQLAEENNSNKKKEPQTKMSDNFSMLFNKFKSDFTTVKKLLLSEEKGKEIEDNKKIDASDVI